MPSATRELLREADVAGMIRIVGDGTTAGTRVLMPDGTPVPGVSGFRVEMRAGKRAVVHLEFARVYLDLEVDEAEAGAGGAGKRFRAFCDGVEVDGFICGTSDRVLVRDSSAPDGVREMPGRFVFLPCDLAR